MKIRLHPEAQNELIKNVVYYEKKALGLGASFLNEFEKTAKYIHDFPLASNEIDSGIRRSLMDKFEYGIIYFIHNDTVEILAIAHSKRKPNYWIKRK
jgi:toxin ParE1/3/4